MPGWERPPWLPTVWHLLAVSMVSALGTWVGIVLTRQAANVAAVWFVDGILLAVVLVRPVRLWPALLAAGLAGVAVAGRATGNAAFPQAVMLAASLVSVLVPATVLRALARRRGGAGPPDFTHARVFIEFLVIAVALTPALSGLVMAPLLAPVWHTPVLPLLSRWYLSQALGTTVMTPLALSLLRGELMPLLVPAALPRTLGVVGSFTLVVAAVFGQDSLPLLFLPFPVLLLVVARLGFPGAGLVILPTAAIGFGMTVAGHGPLMLIQAASPTQRLALLQIYVAIVSGTAYAIGIITAERRRLSRALLEQHVRLARSERLYRLLADNASDIITRVPLDGSPIYVSPSVGDVLGWTVGEMQRTGLRPHVHPDDAAIFLSVREQMMAGVVSTSVTFRCRRASGSWAWVEARVHLVRDISGSPSEFIGIVRDISRQKEVEQALEAAISELAEQATTDGLTGLANRRRFDEALPKEWRRAMRIGEPLSLLLIDADHFKAYNDRYGHQGGDECLRLIADTMAMVIHRPHDLVARYGGEEFVAVLPATTLAGAVQIAGSLRTAIAGLEVPHAAAPFGAVTVSVGVACVVPTSDSLPATLVAAADNALYAAKRGGRDRVAVAEAADPGITPGDLAEPVLAAPLRATG